MCKQKITERCVNISKIKKITLFPPLPLPRKGAKRVPRNWRIKSVVNLERLGNLGIIKFRNIPITNKKKESRDSPLLLFHLLTKNGLLVKKQNYILWACKKIRGEKGNFAPNKKASPQHTKAYVRISLIAERCKFTAQNDFFSRGKTSIRYNATSDANGE